MGYTHRFPRQKDPTLKQWGNFIRDARKLIAYVKQQHIVAINAKVKDFYVDVNGVGADACENLLLLPIGADVFNFCKTARKPYDVVVVALLCIYDNTCPGSRRITSDGWRDELLDGSRLATVALGREIPVPATVAARPDRGVS